MDLLSVFQLSRSSYYYVKNISDYDKYKEIKQEILEISRQHKNRYGYRRITQELRNKGIIINHKTVNKLMRTLKIECVQIKRKYKSYKGSESETVPNIINRNFKADTTNLKWTTDITEFSLLGKKLYLSPLLDMYNGEIISYTIDYHPDLQLVMDMLNKALKNVKIGDGLIIHSDQGWHYQHKHYRHTLKKHKIIQKTDDFSAIPPSFKDILDVSYRIFGEHVFHHPFVGLHRRKLPSGIAGRHNLYE